MIELEPSSCPHGHAYTEQCDECEIAYLENAFDATMLQAQRFSAQLRAVRARWANRMGR